MRCGSKSVDLPDAGESRFHGHGKPGRLQLSLVVTVGRWRLMEQLQGIRLSEQFGILLLFDLVV